MQAASVPTPFELDNPIRQYWHRSPGNSGQGEESGFYFFFSRFYLFFIYLGNDLKMFTGRKTL